MKHTIFKTYGMHSLEEILYQEEVCKEFLSEVNPVSRVEIRRYTKSLRPYIKEIYGV